MVHVVPDSYKAVPFKVSHKRRVRSLSYEFHTFLFLSISEFILIQTTWKYSGIMTPNSASVEIKGNCNSQPALEEEL